MSAVVVVSDYRKQQAKQPLYRRIRYFWKKIMKVIIHRLHKGTLILFKFPEVNNPVNGLERDDAYLRLLN